jgi:NAD(P)-dependent dehydrogenase (short-subunit alcohol dehydrogenase family)
VAFITGGSSGIGLGIARAFADAGMRVVVGYQTEQHLEEAMTHLMQSRDRVHAIGVDVTNRPAMEKAAQDTLSRFGKVHVLVNNAGVVQHAPLRETTYDDWDWMMSVNLDGVFNGIHTFLPHIQAHGEGGQIITTSSIIGLFTAADCAVYSATKYAVVGLTESLRIELARANIGVSVFCPGPVISGLQDGSRNRPSHLAETQFKQSPEAYAEERAFRNDPECSMDPLEAGRIVLRGMRQNDLYILSHPEFEPIMQDRHEALLASMPRELHPSQKRLQLVRSLQDNVYTAERDRKTGRRTERE